MLRVSPVKRPPDPPRRLPAQISCDTVLSKVRMEKKCTDTNVDTNIDTNRADSRRRADHEKNDKSRPAEPDRRPAEPDRGPAEQEQAGPSKSLI